MPNSEHIFWSCSGVCYKVCNLGAEHQAPKWLFTKTLKVNASAMTKWRPNRLGDLMVT